MDLRLPLRQTRPGHRRGVAWIVAPVFLALWMGYGPSAVVPGAVAEPPPTAAPRGNEVLLQPGAEGDEVMALQRHMRLLGLYQGEVDGRYGEATKAAISAFQTSAGLPASGTLDQGTWERMNVPQLLADGESDGVMGGGGDGEGEEDGEDGGERSFVRRFGGLILGGGVALAALAGWRRWRPRKGATEGSPVDTSALGDEGELEAVGPQAKDVSPQMAPLANPAGVGLAGAAMPLEATTRLSPGDVVDALVSELDSPDGGERRHAIWALGQRGSSVAIQPLVDRLLLADSQEKSLILAALAEISSRNLKPMHRALALGLQDPSPEVRKNAIRDLSRVYDTVVQLSHMLAHASQDPDPGVQETAQWALSQLNRIPAAPYTGEPPGLDAATDSERLPPG